MMSYVCITGGIGVGKSFVCKLLQQRGIKIYDCDSAAKRLMNESLDIKEGIIKAVGGDAYKDGRLNKPVVAKYLLASEKNKQLINSIVHPAVMEDFRSSGTTWMESAILYEANLEKFVDVVVAVTAPRDVRVSRIMKRDNISEEKAKEWIDKQMSQEDVVRRADYVICNDGVNPLSEQIDFVLEKIK